MRTKPKSTRPSASANWRPVRPARRLRQGRGIFGDRPVGLRHRPVHFRLRRSRDLARGGRPISTLCPAKPATSGSEGKMPSILRWDVSQARTHPSRTSSLVRERGRLALDEGKMPSILGRRAAGIASQARTHPSRTSSKNVLKEPVAAGSQRSKVACSTASQRSLGRLCTARQT